MIKPKQFLAAGISLAGVVLIILAVALYINGKPSPNAFTAKPSGDYTVLTGTVTAYDQSPNAYDGSTIFAISSQPVNIGGGNMAPDTAIGTIERPLAVGDKVTAKVKVAADGTYTIVGCADCYVKKR